MSNPAGAIETEIRRLLRDCSLLARGVWLDVRYVIDHESDRPGFLQRDAKPLTNGSIAKLIGLTDERGNPAEMVSDLLSELGDAGLLVKVTENHRSVYYAPLLIKLEKARTTGRTRAQRLRERIGVTCGVSNATRAPDTPPDGFPLQPPSLSPPILSPGVAESESGPSPAALELRRDALRAFGEWSFSSRGMALNELAGEHRHVFDLLQIVDQERSIARGHEVIPRSSLVPLAAEHAKKAGTQFKAIKFACGVVKNKLDDWCREGVPGSMEFAGNRTQRGRGPAAVPPAPTLNKPLTRNF